MSIISQIGVVILIAFIVLVLIRSNKNLKKASDEWALRQEKKEEIKQKREEKKLEVQKEKKQKKIQKQEKRKENLIYENTDEQSEDMPIYEDTEEQAEDRIFYDNTEEQPEEDRPGYDGESLRVNTDWLYDYEEKEKQRQEQTRTEQYRSAGDKAEERSGKIVPMKKRQTTGITLMKLDANHRVMARYRVNQIPFTIGRSTNNDLVLDDLCVARNHCRIVEKDGRYVLEDVGTMNKLYVNGMMTSQVPLSDGVRVYIGNEEFQIEVEGRRSQSTRLYKNVEGIYE